jgi:hypothetical protein
MQRKGEHTDEDASEESGKVVPRGRCELVVVTEIDSAMVGTKEMGVGGLIRGSRQGRWTHTVLFIAR